MKRAWKRKALLIMLGFIFIGVNLLIRNLFCAIERIRELYGFH